MKLSKQYVPILLKHLWHNDKQLAIGHPMNTRQELLTVIEQLPDEQLSALLNLALSLKSGKNSAHPMPVSQAEQDWVSAENDIYDELLANSQSKEHQLDRRAVLKLPVAQRNALLSQQVAIVAEHFQPGAEGMEWTDQYVEDEIVDDE